MCCLPQESIKYSDVLSLTLIVSCSSTVMAVIKPDLLPVILGLAPLPALSPGLQ